MQNCDTLPGLSVKYYKYCKVIREPGLKSLNFSYFIGIRKQTVNTDKGKGVNVCSLSSTAMYSMFIYKKKNNKGNSNCAYGTRVQHTS